MMPSDAELMRRLATGDQQAFAELVSRHSATVLNVIYRIVLSRDDAEDLCQEVFEKLWLNAGQWLELAQLSTWLFRVASNLAINHRQRFQRRHVVDDGVVQVVSDERQLSEAAPAEPMESSRQAAVADALSSLPDNQCAALVFRYYQGLSLKEIADIMNVSSKAVESLLSRGKTQLRSDLGALFNDFQ